jgi:hypothetical protein
MGSLRHYRPRLVPASASRRLRVRLRAGQLDRAGRPAEFACAGDTVSAQMRYSPTASRSPPGRCDATARSPASRAAIWRPVRILDFTPISCSDLAKGDGLTVVVEICAATLWWTIVVLRDERRCRSWRADVAQLVAHHLAKVRVAGSNPVIRSKVQWHQPSGGVAEW